MNENELPDGVVEYDEETDIALVACPMCGHVQADMGRNIRCENCGAGPMPTMWN